MAEEGSGPGRGVPAPLRGAPDAHERVLVIPRSSAFPDGDWRGVRVDGVDAFLARVEEHGTYRPRAEVENDPRWKQVIPYLLLRDGERVFLMHRTRAGGDPRLYERYSIGVGGHVRAEDGGVAGGLAREWREEIRADFQPAFRAVGLINDDGDPVGAVHIGVVYEADVRGRSVAVREVDKLRGEFVDPEEVARLRDRLETWSALLFEFLEVRSSASATAR